MVYGGVLQIAFTRVQKTTGNPALERLVASEVTLQMAHGCHLDPRVRQGCQVRGDAEALDKATRSARGNRTRVQRGRESRSIMVPSNGMVHKLKEELKNDGALLFGSYYWHTWTLKMSILAYYFCSLHIPFVAYILILLLLPFILPCFCCLEKQQYSK